MIWVYNMAFWKTDNSFDGENFQVDRNIKQKVVETHEFTIRDKAYEEYTNYCKAFMDSNGQLTVSSSARGDVLLCENKKELKKFISWLIIAYKDIFND